MTVQVMKYARELLELEIPSETVGETEAILDELPELLEALSDPTAKIEKKHRVIDRIFPEEIRDFLKLLCDNEACGDIKEIFKAALLAEESFHLGGDTSGDLHFHITVKKNQIPKHRK